MWEVSDSGRMGMSDGGGVGCSSEIHPVHAGLPAELHGKSGCSAWTVTCFRKRRRNEKDKLEKRNGGIKYVLDF
jgi:hypothetical protein